MAAKQLSDGNPDGTVLGQTATDLVGFFGADAVDQPATIADATASATSAATAVNAVIAALEELGLLASS